MSLILRTDSYKLSQFRQYPPKTTNIYSYFESRGGLFKEITFFGLQYILYKLYRSVCSKGSIDYAEVKSSQHGVPFNKDGWKHINEVHNDQLPVRICAVPEGLTIPVSNVLFTIENTCPECYWVTSYLETLLVQSWYPITVCTLSREMKKLIKIYMEKSCDNLDSLPFKLHDFGFRGVSSLESAGIGGMAHLVNFMGTDTLEAIAYAERYYDSYRDGICAFSVPASEHSTMTSWGRDNEVAAYENMLNQFPEGIVSVVSDSYNVFEACEKIWGGVLKDKVMARKGTTVIRFDSGDVISTIVGGLNILMEKFGHRVNSKGYKVLPDQVRVLQGDGIDYDMTKDIIHALDVNKLSMDNIATLGMGGALLQKINRDTQKFALKCSAAKVDGNWIDVYKEPVGDKAKISKKGRQALILEDGKYKTIQEKDLNGRENILIPVFENGRILKEHNFKEVRDRAKL